MKIPMIAAAVALLALAGCNKQEAAAPAATEAVATETAPADGMAADAAPAAESAPAADAAAAPATDSAAGDQNGPLPTGK